MSIICDYFKKDKSVIKVSWLKVGNHYLGFLVTDFHSEAMSMYTFKYSLFLNERFDSNYHLRSGRLWFDLYYFYNLIKIVPHYLWSLYDKRKIQTV